MNTTDDFKKKQEHHIDCLKHIFHQHYQTWCRRGVPISKRKRNDWWVIHLPEPVVFEIQLHLVWVLVGKNVFRWTRLQIGKAILKVFKKLKILNDLIEDVRKDETVMNLYWNQYMEHEI